MPPLHSRAGGRAADGTGLCRLLESGLPLLPIGAAQCDPALPAAAAGICPVVCAARLILPAAGWDRPSRPPPPSLGQSLLFTSPACPWFSAHKGPWGSHRRACSGVSPTQNKRHWHEKSCLCTQVHLLTHHQLYHPILILTLPV